MPKRVLQGVVVSNKNDKTIVVEVERRYTHPLLKKTVRRTTTRRTSSRPATASRSRSPLRSRSSSGGSWSRRR